MTAVVHFPFRGPRGDRAASSLERAAAALAYRQTGDPFPYLEAGRPPLRIGLCSSLSRGFLRDLIRAIRADSASPLLAFREGAAEELIKATSFNQIDLAFIPGRRDWWRLRSEVLWHEALVLMSPEGGPLTHDTEVRPAALRDETLLVAGGPAEVDFQTELLARAIGARPRHMVAVDVEKETLLDLVSLGCGLSLTTSSALGAFHPGVAYRPVTPPAEAIPFHAVWRAIDCDGGLAGVLEMARHLASGWRETAVGRSSLCAPRPEGETP
jgi:DNA-binding transcriptional LysR family regulator